MGGSASTQVARWQEMDPSSCDELEKITGPLKATRKYELSCCRFLLSTAWQNTPAAAKNSLLDPIKKRALALLQEWPKEVGVVGVVGVGAAIFIDAMGKEDSNMDAFKAGMTECMVGFKAVEATGTINGCMQTLYTEIPATPDVKGKTNKVDDVCKALHDLISQLGAHLEAQNEWTAGHGLMFHAFRCAICTRLVALKMQQDLKSCNSLDDLLRLQTMYHSRIQALLDRYITLRMSLLTFHNIHHPMARQDNRVRTRQTVTPTMRDGFTNTEHRVSRRDFEAFPGETKRRQEYQDLLLANHSVLSIALTHP